MSWKVDLRFLGSMKLKKHKPSWCFQDFHFTLSYYKNNFYPENFSYFLWTSKQQITLRMIFLEHNSLKWDIFFNPIFIPCFSESMFFRVRVFQNPGFSGSRSFRVQVFLGPRFLGSRFFRVRVQGLGAGFRSSPIFSLNITET